MTKQKLTVLTLVSTALFSATAQAHVCPGAWENLASWGTGIAPKARA